MRERISPKQSFIESPNRVGSIGWGISSGMNENINRHYKSTQVTDNSQNIPATSLQFSNL